MAKLTDKSAIISLSLSDLIHVVDVDDPTSNPLGTSKKASISQIVALAGGAPTHTGEVTGATALIVDKTAITNKTTVTGVSGDFVLISDTSDAGNLKKVDVVDFLGGAADGNGIYSGSGSLTAATTVTQGGSKLTFLSTAAVGGFEIKSGSSVGLNFYKTLNSGNNLLRYSLENSTNLEYSYLQAGASIINSTTGSEEGAFLVQLSKAGSISSGGTHKFLINGLHQFPESINGGIFRDSNSGGFRWSLNLRNSANAIEPFAALATEIIDNTNGSEDGVLKFYARANGVNFNSSNHQAILTAIGLGIGTATPTEKLEVVGNTKISGNITQTDASASTSLAGGDIRFEDNGGGLPTLWLNQTTYDINTASFWQLGSGASTIQARNVPTGGQFENRIQNDVGKGSKLEFPADVHSSWYQVGNAGITHKYFNMGNTGYGLGLRAGTLEINSANDFVFSKYDGATAPTDLIKILGASGNVGIGTATPTDKLQVVGNLNATRYKVNGVAGANFSGAVTSITIVDGLVTAAS